MAGYSVLEVEAARSLSDSAGSESCSGSIRCSSVKGSTCLVSMYDYCLVVILDEEGGREQHTDECNVISLGFAGETRKVRQPAKGRDAREDRVGLACQPIDKYELNTKSLT